MKRASRLLFGVALLGTVSGCDGFTLRRATIDLGKTAPSNFSAATVQTNDFRSFFPLIESVALKNGLKCNSYNENEKYFGCGIGTFNLMTYVKEEHVVQVELSEFGPWGKTKRFEKLEKDVNEMLSREFPGAGLTLRPAK